MSDESGSALRDTPGSTEQDDSGATRRIRAVRSRLSPVRLIAYLVLVLLVISGLAFVTGWRPSIPNPFEERTIDRSSPAVLRSLEDLSEYHAASAHFEVVVDLEEDSRWIPDALRGERTLFVGVGTVDSVIDFGKLGDGAVTVSADRRSVTIQLPAPTISEPRLDLAKSYVVARQRGVLNRVGGLFGGQSNDSELYQTASAKMADAANADGQVLALAKTNTTAMLRGLLGALGFTDVKVTYAEDPK
ncbi:hypothetical protein BBK14_02230 [Parafrankia soli]|uniref:DUF4230 domain-containing protein n=1 Tax=Parafrankia soli TaxID=2599596 RepID=A0A1S1QUF1_9ACTN|nr:MULTISPECIES: DUF4230 domain-containing protein [Parafrankia]OHV37226.1 hypothetical protein BBK14_02230 [Parafrankia soli]CAI7977603.1 putative secreted protein [Frankia sp. Hr75.2]SQD99898.1 putative secreted protein [Parafrankia sp. Ea1.12]